MPKETDMIFDGLSPQQAQQLAQDAAKYTMARRAEILRGEGTIVPENHPDYANFRKRHKELIAQGIDVTHAYTTLQLGEFKHVFNPTAQAPGPMPGATEAIEQEADND